MGAGWKINVIWQNIKINQQKLADICGHELPTHLQNFTEKDLTEVKILQKYFRGYFLKHPVYVAVSIAFVFLSRWAHCVRDS